MSYLPQLEIRDYGVELLMIESNPVFEGKPPASTTVTVGVGVTRHPVETKAFLLHLEVILSAEDNAEPHPYWLRVRLTGSFESRKEMEGDEVPAFAIENAQMILYGIVRGMVGSATGNGRWGRYTIPSVAFRGGASDEGTTIRDSPANSESSPAPSLKSSKPKRSPRKVKPKTSARKR